MQTVPSRRFQFKPELWVQRVTGQITALMDLGCSVWSLETLDTSTTRSTWLAPRAWKASKSTTSHVSEESFVFAVDYGVTVLAFENGVAALTVDGKMAILHIYRPVQLWCGDYPAGLCRVSVGQKSTLCAYQMAVPGQRRTENPR